MNQNREQLATGRLLVLMAVCIATPLVSCSSTTPDTSAVNLAIWFTGLSVFVVVVTICLAMAMVCFRATQGQPVAIEGQLAILAGSIALFGILITGVFVITAFRIDERSQETARIAADIARESARTAYEAEMQDLLEMHDVQMEEMSEQFSARLMTVAEQASRRSSILSGVSTNTGTAADLEIGVPERLVLTENESRSLEFVVPTSGTYAIDVIAITQEFDPFLYLYDGIAPDAEVLEDNDDGGAGLNSHIERTLAPGRYRIRVEELGGFPGECQVLITSRL